MKEFPLIISNRLLNVLLLIDHKIAKDLISLNGDKDILVTQTFIDIDPKNIGYITFIQPNKVETLLNIDEENIKDTSIINKLTTLDVKHAVYNSFRSSTRIGRFITGNFPGKYNNSVTGTQSDVDVETFVNMFKSAVNRETTFKLMDVVNGEKISYWYNYRKYYDQNGSLGNSCMKSVSSDYFDVYTKNPDKCSLVIMYNNSTKQSIKGRALLWKLDIPEGRYFMDRIYTSNYADSQVFVDFAKSNNWLYKSDQSIGNQISIYDPSTSGSPKRMDMMTNLTRVSHRRYPYCDTMTDYSPNKGTLANNEKFGAELIMQSTGGGSQEIRTVYSKHHGCSISKDYAKYCLIGDDYVNRDEAVRVYNFGEEGQKRDKVYSVPGHDSIAKMDLRIKDGDGEKSTVSKWFPKDKCTWSPYLNSWVFTDSSVLVWTNTEKTTQVLEYIKRLDYTFCEIGGEYYVKDNVKKTTVKKKSTKLKI